MPSNQLISAGELNDSLGSGDLIVVDCRFTLGEPEAGRAAYLESHISGAVYAHLDDDLAGQVTASSGRHPLPDPEDFATFVGQLGVASTKKVVVYDAGSGAIAARAWWLFRWIGHSNVRLLDGGYSEWLAIGGAISAGQESITAEHFEARPGHEMVVTTRELVEAGANRQALNLVDARDQVRFRGQREPIDAVAGHIPGARNLPLDETLNQNGTFRDVDELQAIWNQVLGTDQDKPWVATCGSGVTACHLALTAMQAGRREPRVYIGSWSEWIRDPDRPVGKGP